MVGLVTILLLLVIIFLLVIFFIMIIIVVLLLLLIISIMARYQDEMPSWMSSAELLAAGYNVEPQYKPYISSEELQVTNYKYQSKCKYTPYKSSKRRNCK